MESMSVLISGAGIGGPALAYWLDRYGFCVTVVEKAPELRPGGQAVDFKGATHRTALSRMGILDDSITSLTETTVTPGVHVTFERSAPRTFDLVVGADGIHSNVRRLLAPRTRSACAYGMPFSRCLSCSSR